MATISNNNNPIIILNARDEHLEYIYSEQIAAYSPFGDKVISTITKETMVEDFEKALSGSKLTLGGRLSYTSLQAAIQKSNMPLAFHIIEKGKEKVVNLIGARLATPLITLIRDKETIDKEDVLLAECLIETGAKVNGAVSDNIMKPFSFYQDIHTPISWTIRETVKKTTLTLATVSKKITPNLVIDEQSRKVIGDFLTEIKHRKEGAVMGVLKKSEFLASLPEDVMAKITMHCFPQLEKAITLLNSAPAPSEKNPVSAEVELMVKAIEDLRTMTERNDALTLLLLDHGAAVYPGIIHGVNQSLARLGKNPDAYKSQYIEKNEEIVISEE